MDCIYGQLSRIAEKVEYTGVSTGTAGVDVNNDTRTIAVSVVKLSPENYLPEVPSANGTYVLKATVLDNAVTFAWVEESTQAICGDSTTCGDSLLVDEQ